MNLNSKLYHQITYMYIFSNIYGDIDYNLYIFILRSFGSLSFSSIKNEIDDFLDMD